jgi:hypothetical protein
LSKFTYFALGMEADTGQVAKALCSMSVQPGPQATPIFLNLDLGDFPDVQDFLPRCRVLTTTYPLIVIGSGKHLITLTN